MAFDYDLLVIGGGSGGVRAARMAAGTGARVALVEEGRLGGTCVLRGCVPKKFMVFASHGTQVVNEARAYGWDASVGGFDWPGFRDRLQGELSRLEGVYGRLLQDAGVDVIEGRATIPDPHEVEVDGRRISAAHILVATGGRPVRPESLPGAERAMVSDDVFVMDALPGNILIVGGGYIACEMACILHGLGVEVTLAVRGAQILRGFDDEARGLVARAMTERGIRIETGTMLEAIGGAELEVAAMPSIAAGGEAPHATRGARGAPCHVRLSSGGAHRYDAVLLATGREPNSAGLGLEALGVGIGRHGHVEVDEYSQTAVPSLYAIGDVTNRPALTPVAIRDAMAFVDTVFRGRPTPVRHDLVASAVFTQPEMGTVGMSEEVARERGPIEVYATTFRPMRTAFIGSEDRVLMKLVVDTESRRVLGCHIVAPEAGEMIQMAAVAIGMGATKEDFDRTVAVHPTMSEEIVTMRGPPRKS
jgi:glutathione reductase (NADPH)